MIARPSFMYNRSRSLFGNLEWFLCSQEMEVNCYIRAVQTQSTRVKVVNKFIKKQNKTKGKVIRFNIGNSLSANIAMGSEDS